MTDCSPTCETTQPCTLHLQAEGADGKEKADARGAGGGRQESWAVGMVASLVIAAVCGLALVPVVGRAKQCWDFAATVYILHMVACSCYTRFPTVIALLFCGVLSSLTWLSSTDFVVSCWPLGLSLSLSVSLSVSLSLSLSRSLALSLALSHPLCVASNQRDRLAVGCCRGQELVGGGHAKSSLQRLCLLLASTSV